MILWNNTSIRVNNLPVFYSKLFSSGCIFVSDLFCEGILKPFNHWVTKGALDSHECIRWMFLIDAIPTAWRQHAKQVFNAKMCLDENYIQLLDSKQVYKCFCSKNSIPPTSMKWICEQFKISDDQMDKVYTIPFKVLIHTKAKELQYKILNKYLATNSFLKKIG